MSNILGVVLKVDLEDMHTGTLMSRRNALLRCEESFQVSDQYQLSMHSDDTSNIEFKNTLQWQQAYQELKSVLSQRGNVQSKQEKKLIRQEQAKHSQ